MWFAQNGGAQRESEAPVEAPQPGTFVAKKSKAAAKKGTGTTQWAILQQSGIPPEDIPQFRSAQKACRITPLSRFGSSTLALLCYQDFLTSAADHPSKWFELNHEEFNQASMLLPVCSR